MNKITVKELKAKLQEALDNLEYEDDDAEIVTSCNTYCMYGWVLEIPSIGFVDIMGVHVKDKEEDE